jgi:hypothetical protein
MTWPLWLVLMLCLLTLAALGLSALGARRWAAATRALLGRLEGGRLDHAHDGKPPPTHYDAREIEGLPAPVQRCFRAVLKDGQPLITAASITMSGTFNMSPTGEQWKPFTAQQRVIARRPGFVWDARIAMLPGLAVHVVDSIVAGTGLLHAAIQGLFTLAKTQGEGEGGGEGEIAHGEIMRWFAEAAWYPTALLPSQGVRWEAVDEHSARATVVDGPLTVTLLFRFDDAGLIASFRAEARASVVNGKQVMAPWEGRWSNYRTRDGMQVPFTGEVAWMRPEGRRPYFVGTVSALRFEFAP